LHAAGEEALWRTRQLDYFVIVIEAAASHLRGAGEEVWARRLSFEDGNFNTALEWALASGNTEAGLRLVATLWWYWELQGDFQYSRQWLERMVQQADNAPAAHENPTWLRAYAQALLGLGTVMWNQGDHIAARNRLEQCIVKAEQVGDRWTYAYALDRLGRVLARHGAPARARSLYEQSLAIFRELKDTWGISRPLRDLGRLATQEGDFSTAITYLQEALAQRRTANDHEGIADALNSLGDAYWIQGQYGEAEPYFAECLALNRAIGYKDGIGIALQNLGFMALLQRQPERAHSLLTEALVVRHGLGERQGMAQNLVGLCGIALAHSDIARAVRLIGAIEVTGQSLADTLPPNILPVHNHNLAVARAALAETTFTQCYAEGRAMTLEQAVAYALSEPQTPQPTEVARVTVTPQTKWQAFGGLTARQREVAALIAQGQSNREIAETLVLSEYTVMAHVGHILNKLGFDSRRQIAAWAIEKGLIKPPAP
jgi:non-specific serine/threonine protein kinase